MSTYNKYLFERYTSEVKLEDRNWLYSNLKNYFLDITFPKVRKHLSTIAAFLCFTVQYAWRILSIHGQIQQDQL